MFRAYQDVQIISLKRDRIIQVATPWIIYLQLTLCRCIFWLIPSIWKYGLPTIPEIAEYSVLSFAAHAVSSTEYLLFPFWGVFYICGTNDCLVSLWPLYVLLSGGSLCLRVFLWSPLQKWNSLFIGVRNHLPPPLYIWWRKVIFDFTRCIPPIKKTTCLRIPWG